MSACCLAQTPRQSPYETQKNIEIFLFVLKNFSKKHQPPPTPLFMPPTLIPVPPIHPSREKNHRSAALRFAPFAQPAGRAVQLTPATNYTIKISSVEGESACKVQVAEALTILEVNHSIAQDLIALPRYH